jgi:hypothetical protein
VVSRAPVTVAAARMVVAQMVVARMVVARMVVAQMVVADAHRVPHVPLVWLVDAQSCLPA